MGLLSRFRTSSISNTTSTSVQNDSRSSSTPKTPNPAPPPATPSFLSPHPQSEPPLRPSIPPPSPSASSVASRISRKPWKRTKSNQPQASPTAPLSSLRGKKGNEKGKAENSLFGIAYEEMPQSPPKPTFEETRTAPVPSTPQANNRISMFHNGQAVPSSPLRSPTSDRTFISTHTGTAPKAGTSRPDSGLFKQAGGVLGKLGFEVVESPKKEDDLEDTHEDLWLEAASDTGHADHIDSSPSGLPDLGSATSTISDTGESVVVIDKNDLTPDREVDPDVSATSAGADEDGMEMMETPEKKGKFWKGMGRARRGSKAATDYAEVERSGSPTPRKTAVLDTPVDLAEAQPRPPPLRRPSSSLFHNPFNRSASRASLALDLDKSPVDNGSFQLRGFRHVSGMSEVEGAGGLEGYLSHVKKESTAFLPLDNPTMSTPVLTTDTPRPPSSYPRPKIQNNSSSRPPSISGSLASVDDLIASSNKVSVAAFRRGIRRPSEVFGTTSDLGHGGYARDEEENDDDKPLGMLNRSGETSESKSRSRSREKSTASLSGMRELAAPDARPDRESSPSPALSFTVQRHHRSASGAFLVKSATYTRSDEYSRSTTPNIPRPAAFATPPNTDPPSPAGDAKPVLFASPDMMNQQDILTPVDSYFAQTAPAFTASASKHAPTPLHELRPKPDFNQGAFPSPLPTALDRKTPSPAPMSSSEVLASPKRAAPPVEPIPLPQPGDKTPASLHLPLPPDQMPDTPPKHLHELLQRVPQPTPESQGQTQTGSGKKRLSLLDEPMRLISGFWAQSNQEDGQADNEFDPTLVVNSMNVYGTTEDIPSPNDQQSADVDEDRQLQHQPSRTTLFDIRNASPTPTPALAPIPAPAQTARDDGVRSPLSERLANVAMSSLAKTSLTRLKPATTPFKDDQLPTNSASATIMSPSTADARESAAVRNSPVVESASTLVSSFARAKRGKRFTSAESESDESEGRSEDELGIEAKRRIEHAQQKASLGMAPNSSGNGGERRTSGRRVPGGPRKPSIRNRIIPSASTSIVSLQPLRGERRNSPPHPRNGHGTGQGEKEIFKSDGESDDDEPLAVVRNKASRSSLSLNNISPPNMVHGLPSPMSPTSTISNNSSSTRGQGKSTLVNLGPVNQPLRDQSDERATTTTTTTTRGQRSSSTSISPPPVPSRSPKRASKKQQLSPTSRTTITASPASSVSGTGTNNTYDSSLRLMTPRESIHEPKGREHIDIHKQRAKTPQPQSHSPWQTYPYPHQPQQPTPSMSPMALPQMPTTMPMSMEHNGQMDPAAIHAMMKQQWQMQFMAAAYRASEEEWERASSVSGHDGPSSHHHQQQQQSYFPPNMFYPYGQPMPLPPMGMGMGMGLPFFPGPGGQPLPPNMNVNMNMGGQTGGGMYSYGPSSQSVFGGEFGPPRVNAPSHLIHSSTAATPGSGERARTNSVSQNYQTGGAGARPNLPTASPPSSWRLSTHGMQNETAGDSQSPSTPTGARKIRPQSTFIN